MGEGAREQPANSTPATPRRWFRFSLRTLVIFVLLVGSGMGLWWKWEPWVPVGVAPAIGDGFKSFVFDAPREDYLIETGKLGKLRVATRYLNRLIPSVADPVTSVMSPSFSSDGTRLLGVKYGTFRVTCWDARTGRELCEIPVLAYQVAFEGDGDHLVAQPADCSASRWIRIRPEWWWGVAWLPEFWLTAVFAVAFAWSVLRDRKTI
ncbi:MAG: hypothetical protein NTW87_05530 [Planctomycetota bacterium]|nr:hypothetical protein [Planctomycetota bacterium]